MSKAPLLILALQKTTSNSRYKAFIWVLTFLTYMSYHLSRRPITIVKNALHQNGSSWVPFDGSNYNSYFGALDVSYLSAYAVGMFLSGHIAERMNLRYFLSAGMLLSGIMTMAFGLGYTWNIHSLAYFIIIQILCGLVQSTGWPGVVACMANWFGKGRRGLIMAIWNAHTSLGNIVGGLIAAAFLTDYWETRGYWMWSFFYPGLIIVVMSVLVFFFLVPDPADVGLPPANSSSRNEQVSSNTEPETAPLINDTESMRDTDYGTSEPTHPSQSDDSEVLANGLQQSRSQHVSGSAGEAKAISFLAALKVPGVIEFSLCLFFAKLVSYTFLYWLPQYIKQIMILYVPLEDPDKTAGDLSTLVDVGGIFGAIFAGYLADVTKSSAITCAIMLIFSVPMLVFYKIFGSFSYANATGLLLATGFMVNAPYCLITTSVSADLGTHSSLSSNAKALATVTAIIDGTGSIGAALGPGITALIEGTNQATTTKMDYIFGILIGSNIMALLLLSRLIYKESLILKEKYQNRQRSL